jgi:hypothetical protein
MTRAVQKILLAAIAAQAPPAGAAWLESARARLAVEPLEALLECYSHAARKTGSARLALDAAGLARLDDEAPGVDVGKWTTADAARAVLLADWRARVGRGDRFAADATECFEQGDAGEQQSWLRALSLWPEAAAFLPAAIETCRSNIIPVFEALACENPYPARHFPERNFNQMVLKALFNGIGISRIAGRAGRLNAELSRMARDYAAERTAAGRSVPADIDLAIADQGRR